MKYLSVCSGIEAATVAWRPLGWQAVGFAEIEPFPCAVLKHHYPDIPNYGDITRFRDWPDATFDVLVGGTPCQSFSVAGLRAGLADPRGNLALTFLAIADRYRPEWVVWENVPGVLSALSHAAPDPCPPPPPLDLGCDGAEVETGDEYDSEELHAFNAFLAGFSELGYLGGYFSLDAQYAGLAQRRERVFALFHLGDWRRAAAVLFERESLSGHPAPRREAGEGTTYSVAPSIGASGRGFSPAGETRGQDCVIPFADLAPTLNAHFGDKWGLEDQHINSGGGMFVAHSLRADGFDASEDGTGRGTPIVPIDLRQASRGEKLTNNRAQGSGGAPGHGVGNEGDPAFTVSERGQAIAYQCQGSNVGEMGTLRGGNGHTTGGVPFTLAICGRGESHDLEYRQDGTANAILTPNGGRGGIGVGAIAFSAKDHGADAGELSPTLRAGGHREGHANGGCMPAIAFDWQSGGDSRGLDPKETAQLQRCQVPAVAFHENQRAELTTNDTAGSLNSGGGKPGQGYPAVQRGMQVRRLMPRECERLMGLPDDYTLIRYRGKPAADGPRYKALGNSMAVPVMAWIGHKIQMVDDVA